MSLDQLSVDQLSWYRKICVCKTFVWQRNLACWNSIKTRSQRRLFILLLY